MKFIPAILLLTVLADEPRVEKYRYIIIPDPVKIEQKCLSLERGIFSWTSGWTDPDGDGVYHVKDATVSCYCVDINSAATTMEEVFSPKMRHDCYVQSRPKRPRR